MTTYNLLVDYDDVIYPWSATAHALCERAGITNGKQIKSWHFWEDYGCEQEEVWEVLRSATVTGELYEAALIPGVLEQMRRLRNFGHRIHIVTARGFGQHGELIKAMTREQVRNWNVPLDSLHFEKDKAAVAVELGIDLAVDDGIHNYLDLNAAGFLVFLMDMPHNQGAVARRVRSFKEFADVVLSVEWLPATAA